MKKVMRIFGLACMASLLVFASCKKNDEKAVTITVSTPELTVEDADRAYIQPNYQFMWEQGDVIKVYNLDADPNNSVCRVFQNISGGPRPRANFSGPGVGPKGSFGYRFFYPETMVTGTEELLSTNNHEIFVVPTEQAYGFYEGTNHPKMIVDPASMPMAVEPVKLTSATNMHHIFGLARLGFTVDEDVNKSVAKIELTDNFFHITGTTELNVTAVNIEELQDLLAEYKTNDANFVQHFQDYVLGDMEWDPYEETLGYTITLNCNYPGSDGGVVLNETNATWFYFLLRPFALSHGFTAKVYFTDHTMLNICSNWNHEMMNKVMEPGILKSFTYNWPINEDLPMGNDVWETWE